MRDTPQPSAPAKRGPSHGKMVGPPRRFLRRALALSIFIHIAGAAGVMSLLLYQGDPDEKALGRGPIRVSHYPAEPTPNLQESEEADPLKTSEGADQNEQAVLHRSSLAAPQEEPQETDGPASRPTLQFERTLEDSTFPEETFPSLVLSAMKEDAEDIQPPFPTEAPRPLTQQIRKQETAAVSLPPPHPTDVEDTEGAPAKIPEEEAGDHPPELQPDAETARAPEEESNPLRDGVALEGKARGTPVKVFADHRVLPRYPLIARRQGLEGTTLLRIQIKPDGRVAKILLLQSSGHSALDQSATEAVHRWRFGFEGDPPPSGMWAVLPIRFELRGQ